MMTIANFEHIESDLPPFVLNKLENLDRVSAKRYEHVSGAYARANEVREKRDRLLATIAKYDGETQPLSPKDVERRDRLKAQAAQLRASVPKIQAESKTLEPTVNPDTLREKLLHYRGKQFRDARAQITLSKEANIAEEIDAVRDAIGEAVRRRRAVVEASLPLAVAESNAIAQIDRVAARGEPNFVGTARLQQVSAKTRRPGRVLWPMLPTASQDSPDAFSLAVWANRDALVERARAQLREHLDGELQLSADERVAALVKLDAEILALERREEALIEIAEEQGLAVLRRPNANLFAVLGIAVGADESSPDETDFG